MIFSMTRAGDGIGGLSAAIPPVRRFPQRATKSTAAQRLIALARSGRHPRQGARASNWPSPACAAPWLRLRPMLVAATVRSRAIGGPRWSVTRSRRRRRDVVRGMPFGASRPGCRCRKSGRTTPPRLGDVGASRRCEPQGGPGTPRAREHRNHDGHLLACVAGPARVGRRLRSGSGRYSRRGRQRALTRRRESREDERRTNDIGSGACSADFEAAGGP